MRYGEKITFVSDDGRTAVFAAAPISPYWLNNATGISGLSANIYTSKGAGQDGETDVSANIAMRSITIEGAIRGRRQAANRRTLLSAVQPRATGKLVYEYNGIIRYIRCRVKQSPVFSNTYFERFQITFTCANPFWREGSGNRRVKEIAQWLPSLTFPLEIPVSGIELEYRAPSLIVNIANTGDVPSSMVIVFRAITANANPYLINVGTQEQIKINTAMLAGDLITVHTGYGEKRVELTRDGVTSNIINALDIESVFLQLEVGDNLLRYGADDTDNLDVTIYYDIAYMGV